MFLRFYDVDLQIDSLTINWNESTIVNVLRLVIGLWWRVSCFHIFFMEMTLVFLKSSADFKSTHRFYEDLLQLLHSDFNDDFEFQIHIWKLWIWFCPIKTTFLEISENYLCRCKFLYLLWIRNNGLVSRTVSGWAGPHSRLITKWSARRRDGQFTQ